MRVTSFMIYDQILRSLQNGQEDYAVLSERLSTGKKILAPSDDTLGALRALDYRVSLSSNEQYRRNIAGAQSKLDIAGTVLSSAFGTLEKIMELAAKSLRGTDPTQAATFAGEAAGYRDHLLDIANTKVGDHYLFSGFRTTVQTFDQATLTYQGDAGVINVPVGKGAAMPMNVTGDEAFSYTPGPDYVKQLGSGLNASYTSAAGTKTVTVEISDAGGTVIDSFSFSNLLQMTDLLGTAIAVNDTTRIEALMDPFSSAQSQLARVQADVGARLSGLKDQSSLLNGINATVRAALAATEDADMSETAIQLQKTDVALQALRASAAQVMSQSLFDFLR